MSYHDEDNTDGEDRVCTEQELTARGGFSVFTPGETNGGLSPESAEDRRTDQYLADAELETPEGFAGALCMLRGELEATGELPRQGTGGS